MSYAANTTVSAEKSIAEIQSTLRRYEAQGFMYGYEGDLAQVSFKLRNLLISMKIRLPPKADYAVSTAGRMRNAKAAAGAWEQACRQRWRALALVVKAKLEAVESGVSTFEEEFLAFIALPGGGNIGQRLIPQLQELVAGASMPLLLGGEKTVTRKHFD